MRHDAEGASERSDAANLARDVFRGSAGAVEEVKSVLRVLRWGVEGSPDDPPGAGLDTLAPAVDGLARAAAVVPGLAGADGPRTILVMFQNPLSNTADAALIESYPMSMTRGRTVGHGRRRHRHDCDGRGPAGVRVRGSDGRGRPSAVGGRHRGRASVHRSPSEHLAGPDGECGLRLHGARGGSAGAGTHADAR